MKPSVPVYDDVADAYSRALDPEGVGLADPVLTGLIGEVAGQEVLSLACGQGQDARLLARLGAVVTGVDVSEEMLRHAREHEAAEPRGVRYVQGDARDLAELGNASFDGVVCHMALMDIPDLRPTIGSVARVLRDDGWFVFSIVHPATTRTSRSRTTTSSITATPSCDRPTGSRHTRITGPSPPTSTSWRTPASASSASSRNTLPAGPPTWEAFRACSTLGPSGRPD